ncbi:MAG: hypothetical protein ACF8SC_11495 [Phycisphaerales bacterium JB037]
MNASRAALPLALACLSLGARAESSLAERYANSSLLALDEPTDPQPVDWTIRAEPSVWWVAMSGDFRVPGTTTAGSRFGLRDLDLDEPSASPFLELHYRNGPWRLSLSGFYIESDGSATAFRPGSFGDVPFAIGDTIDASASLFSGQLAVGYLFEPYRASPNQTGGFDVESWIELTGGVRAYAVDFDATVNGTASAGTDQLFAEPFAGVKWTLELIEEFTIDTELTLGGFSTGSERRSFGVDIIVGLNWRPTPNFGAQLGYRQLAFGLYDGNGIDEFEWRGAVAGVYGGLELRF